MVLKQKNERYIVKFYVFLLLAMCQLYAGVCFSYSSGVPNCNMLQL